MQSSAPRREIESLLSHKNGQQIALMLNTHLAWQKMSQGRCLKASKHGCARTPRQAAKVVGQHPCLKRTIHPQASAHVSASERSCTPAFARPPMQMCTSQDMQAGVWPRVRLCLDDKALSSVSTHARRSWKLQEASRQL